MQNPPKEFDKSSCRATLRWGLTISSPLITPNQRTRLPLHRSKRGNTCAKLCMNTHTGVWTTDPPGSTPQYCSVTCTCLNALFVAAARCDSLLLSLGSFSTPSPPHFIREAGEERRESGEGWIHSLWGNNGARLLNQPIHAAAALLASPSPLPAVQSRRRAPDSSSICK